MKEGTAKTAEAVYQDLRIKGVLSAHDAVEKSHIVEAIESYGQFRAASQSPAAGSGQEQGQAAEVERLKKIINGRLYWIWKGEDTDLSFDEWVKQFKEANNL